MLGYAVAKRWLDGGEVVTVRTRRGQADGLVVGHILRKCDPAEWGGTEMALLRMCDALALQGVENVVFSPRLPVEVDDPFAQAGHRVKRFHAVLPVAGITQAQRRQAVAVGGNLLSPDLPLRMMVESDLHVVHSHTGNRLGATALRVARMRRLPFVMTIHGGVLDLPESVRRKLVEPTRGGLEWGRAFGLLLGTRRLIEQSDLVIAVNRTEARLLGQRYPDLHVQVVPHGIPADRFAWDRRKAVFDAWPVLRERPFVLVAGRIDSPKNQGWLICEWAAVAERHPDTMLVVAGPVTDAAYGAEVRRAAERMAGRVMVVGGLAPEDERLTGLFQAAQAVVLPSVSETFGIVVVEAWAAGTPVLTSRTSGALELVVDGVDGLVFDLGAPQGFHRALDRLLGDRDLRDRLVHAGRRRAFEEYANEAIARRMRGIYEQLVARVRP